MTREVNNPLLPAGRRPILCFLGPGRAGKDTACEYLRDRYGFRFEGSSSWAMRHFVASRLGLPVDEAWATRHDNRMEWKQILDEYRRTHGQSSCIREMLKFGDLVCGLRDHKEIAAGVKEGLLDLVVWVENVRVPVDPTVEFREDHCDVTVLNNGTLESYYAKLDRLMAALGVPRAGPSR